MDYIGSKDKINEWMFSKILKYFPSTEGKVFLDACSGSACVSRFAAEKGFKILACDLLSFPRHIANGSIGVKSILSEAREHLSKMNALPGVDGYFYENFCQHADRLYLTDENARRLDACRQYLDRVVDPNANPKLFSILIYSLLEAMSRVSNTAGTYGAFLKQYKARALAPLTLKIEESVEGRVWAYQDDILHFLEFSPHRPDVMYIDPPYNERQYAPNYHLYEALVRYDDAVTRGKTGLRDWSDSKSDFCSQKTFFEFLGRLLESANVPLIFFSYNSDGMVSRDKIENFLLQNKVSSVTCHSIAQKRYKADNSRKNNDEFLKEFLFEIILD